MNFTEQIIASPEGGTVSLTGDPLPAVGYFIGGVVAPLILGPQELDTAEGREMIDTFIAYLNGPTVGALYLGWWTDEDTNAVYVDGTSWRSSYEQAETLCRTRKEIAFYDIERQRSFRPVVS